jgi:hypothetical protein
MSKSAFRRIGVPLAAVAVMTTAAACQSGGDEKDSGAQSAENPTQVLTAAYKKTSEAKSAKVRMTMTVPAGAPDGGGDVEMTGVMGWDPTVMDMTMTGSVFKEAGAPSGLDKIRMLWSNNVMYMDMGAEAAKEMDGKRWMTFDIAALAKESGDAALQKQLTGSLENMNQDPAQQLALMLESKTLKHVGPAKVDGVDTEHYKGTITVDEMLNSNESLKVMDSKGRQELLDAAKKSGIKGYDIQLWVNKDGYPAKMDTVMDSAEGKVTVTANYSDYGTTATVTPPPAEETFDLMKMMKEIQDAAGTS